jgi:hypothetical protein
VRDGPRISLLKTIRGEIIFQSALAYYFPYLSTIHPSLYRISKFERKQYFQNIRNRLATMAPFQSFTTLHGSPDGSITEGIYAGRELKGNELLIRITYSGVCGTDLHNLHRDMVLGHEGVGTIEGSGDGVKGNWKM